MMKNLFSVLVLSATVLMSGSLYAAKAGSHGGAGSTEQDKQTEQDRQQELKRDCQQGNKVACEKLDNANNPAV